jgi:hypothetical protein
MLSCEVTKEHSELFGHHLLDLLSTGKDYAMYVYTVELNNKR